MAEVPAPAFPIERLPRGRRYGGRAFTGAPVPGRRADQPFSVPFKRDDEDVVVTCVKYQVLSEVSKMKKTACASFFGPHPPTYSFHPTPKHHHPPKPKQTGVRVPAGEAVLGGAGGKPTTSCAAPPTDKSSSASSAPPMYVGLIH